MDRYSERGDHRWGEEERRYGYGDRGFWDRFSDEVRSWFGDEDAQRRRIRDEHEDWRGGRSGDWRARDWSRSTWGPPDWSRGDWRRPEWDRGDRTRGDWRGEGRRGDWGGDRGAWGRGMDDREWAREWGYVEGRGGYGSGGHLNINTGSSTSAYGAGGFSPEYGRGQHAGRGPRNYRRSDERIREDLCERFTHHGHLDATDLDVRVQNGEVTLSGTVSDRWGKRTAEEIAESVWGVKDVHNQIRVVQEQGLEGRDDPNRIDPNRTGPQRGTWAA